VTDIALDARCPVCPAFGVLDAGVVYERHALTKTGEGDLVTFSLVESDDMRLGCLDLPLCLSCLVAMLLHVLACLCLPRSTSERAQVTCLTVSL
jgi:hypothetical protein